MNFLQSNFGLFFWQTTEITPSVGILDILWMLSQTAIALVLICGLAVLIFRYILPKLNGVTFNKSIVRVVDGASLEARKRLLVVEVAGKYMLLAVSESGVQLISELDGAAIEDALAKLEQTKAAANPQLKKAGESFNQIMEQVWKKKK